MARFLVITPVYNCKDYIDATLRSVRDQTDSDWIHYLVDGGSTDGTLEILEQAVAEDRRRRLIRGPDSGMYDALFKGFDQALLDGYGDPQTICVWINGDDLLMPWAFARLRQAFDEPGVEWVMAIPTHWDSRGRLAYVSPFNCHPRWLVRAGQFNGSSLGWIQQESTFFTRSLLSRLAASEVEKIRSQTLAGDFLLWRAFSRLARPVPLMTVVSGFRQHGGNASSSNMVRYVAEVKASGVWLPPEWLGKGFRKLWHPLALVLSYRAHNRQVNKILCRDQGSQ